MPLIVDLACGPGGFSDGWELAGGNHRDVIGFDWAYPARASYRHGVNGYRRVYHLDLFKPEEAVERILRATGGRRPDWVIGSSSCKGWTPSGKREGADDKRDTLLPWLTVVGMLAPTTGAVMENVKQASGHPDWGRGIQAIGIPLVSQWTLKAWVYGAPSKRIRTFWGFRRDGQWPTPPLAAAVECRFGSVVSSTGGQYGSRRLPENSYLYHKTKTGWSDPTIKHVDGWTILSLAEAMEAQGCTGKRVCGDGKRVAQQIADMVPPPMAAAVIRAVMKRTGVLTAEGATA